MLRIKLFFVSFTQKFLIAEIMEFVKINVKLINLIIICVANYLFIKS